MTTAEAWTSRAPEVPASAPSPTGAGLAGDFLRFDDLRARCAHPTWHLDPNVNVFFNPNLSVHGAEQFRTLRSRLYQLRGTQSLRTLLVTSSVPGEGKTFVTANLAQAIVRQPDRRASDHRRRFALRAFASAAGRTDLSRTIGLPARRGR